MQKVVEVLLLTYHNRVNGTDAGTRQHGNWQFQHHWHVNRNSVAFADAMSLQHIRKTAHFLQQLLVGYLTEVIRMIALPV